MDMALGRDNVHAYLVERAVISAEDECVVTECSGGVSGVTFLVETAQRRLVVKQALPRLRTASEWRSDPRRAVVEAQALAAFAAVDAAAVPVVLDVDAAGCAFTMTAAPPGSRPWKELLLDGEIRPAVGRWLGRLLGNWHASTASASDGVFDDDRWFRELRVVPFYERVMETRPDLAGPIARHLDRLLSRRAALVHGDCSPKNILVHPDGSTWLIDFEVCHRGDPAFDLAFVLHHLLLKAVHRPQSRALLLDCARAVLTGYGEAPTTVPLPMDHLLAHVGCLSLARVVGTSPVNYLSALNQDRVLAIGAELVVEAPSALEDCWPH
jgi:aminoglycoside phosphotransferase (APT) family kinase protein